MFRCKNIFAFWFFFSYTYNILTIHAIRLFGYFGSTSRCYDLTSMLWRRVPIFRIVVLETDIAQSVLRTNTATCKRVDFHFARLHRPRASFLLFRVSPSLFVCELILSVSAVVSRTFSASSFIFRKIFVFFNIFQILSKYFDIIRRYRQEKWRRSLLL